MKTDVIEPTAEHATTCDFKIRVVSTTGALRNLAPEWKRLWSLSRDGLPFQHHAWLLSFVETLGAETPWQVLVAENKGVPHAILPLARGKHSRTWRLLGSPNSDYQEIISDPASVSSAFHAMLDHLRKTGARGLLCEDVPMDSLLKNTLEQSGFLQAETTRPCPCPAFHLAEDVLAVYMKRSGVKDNERRVAKLGTVEFRVLHDPQERMEALETLFGHHRARWSSRSQFHDPTACHFFRQLCAEPSFHSLLHISQLLAGGSVIASHLGFVAQDRFIYYKPAFDPDKKGAGQVLLNRLLTDAVRTGLKEFDFTRGGEEYKSHFTTKLRMNHTIQIFFSRKEFLWHSFVDWMRRNVPRDESGAAIPAKWVRRLQQAAARFRGARSN